MESNASNNQNSLRPPSGSSSPSKASTMRKFRLAVPQNAEGGFKLKISSPAGQQSQGNLSAKSNGKIQMTNGSTLSTSVADSQAFQTVNNSRMKSPNLAEAQNRLEQKDQSYLSEPSLDAASPSKIQLKKDSIKPISRHEGQVFQHANRNLYKSSDGRQSADVQPYNTPQSDNHRERDNSKGLLQRAGDQIVSPRDFGPMKALAQLANVQKLQQNYQIRDGENQNNLRQSADDKMMTLRNMNSQLQGQNQLLKSRSPNTSQTILPLINTSNASTESPDMPKKKQLVIRLKSNNQGSSSQNRAQNTGVSPNMQKGGFSIMATQVPQGMPNLSQVSSGQNENSRYTQRANARADSCEQTINNTNTAMVQIALLHHQNMQMQQDAQKYFMTQQGFRQDGNYQRGIVSATKGSRTGILAKSGTKAIYQPFTPQKREEDDGTTLPSVPNLLNQNRQVNESQNRSPSKNARAKSKGLREGSNTRTVMPKLTPLRIIDHESLGSLGSWGSGDGVMNSMPLGKLSQGGKSRAGSHDRVISKPAMNIQKEGVITEDGPKTEDREQKGPLPKIKLKGKNVMLKSGPKNGQPFDFNYIKVLIKKGGSDKDHKEVFVDRDWVSKNNNVPHFANVIKNVDRSEGVEITMNCNCDAFKWIIDFVKIKTNGDDEKEELQQKFQFVSEKKLEKIDGETELKLEEELDNITNESCLNVMVTAYFLQLFWVYNKVWEYYFSRAFSEVINNCKISLSNINQAIVKDIATRISDTQLESMTERKDKFISNVYKARIDSRILTLPEVTENLEPEGEYKGRRFVLPEAEVTGQDLYWCANCQMVLTKAQAMTISCVEIKKKEKSITQSSSQSKLINPVSEDDPSDQIMETYRDNTDHNQQDSFIDNNGQMFYYHDLVFPEEVPYLAADMLEKESNFQISSTEPIATENFVKFFREKYRLCWKEIYLKFSALMYLAEQCKYCRENFQLTQIAGCTGQTDQNFTRYATQPFQLEKEYIQHQKMESLRFHEVDIDSKLVDSQNYFSKFHYRMFKTQFQVTDSLSFPLEGKQSSYTANEDEEKKNFDHHKSLIESYKESDLEFVEPQSMNYDTKINQAYLEFLKQDKMRVSKQEHKLVYSSGLNTSQTVKKSINVAASVDLINKAGQKLETVEEQADDILYRCSNHQSKINKKLQDSKFMKKLYKQCEEYILDNPEEFAKTDAARAKFDFADQKMIVDKGKKKKGQEGELDSHQAAACQALVIKKFKRTKKNIMYQEDINSMEILENYLLKIRNNSTDREFNSKSNNMSSQRNNSNSHRQNLNQQRGTSPVGPQNRFRSPVGKVDNIKLGNQTQNCDLSSQSGVKIYSDIKQITVKKAITVKKSADKSSIPASGAAARKNFLQRNIARSQGARSGSNHHTNAPTIQQDNQDNQSVGTPIQKQRHVPQNNSASRIQTQAQGLTNPLNQQSVHQRHQNFMTNTSQDQIKADQISPQAQGITAHSNFQQAVNQAINQDVQRQPQRYMRSPNPGISGQNLTNLQGIANAQANLQNLKSNMQITSAGMNSLQLPQNNIAVNNSQQLLNMRSNSGNPTQSAGPARGSNRSPQLKIRPGKLKIINPPQSQGSNQQ